MVSLNQVNNLTSVVEMCNTTVYCWLCDIVVDMCLRIPTSIVYISLKINFSEATVIYLEGILKGLKIFNPQNIDPFLVLRCDSAGLAPVAI